MAIARVARARLVSDLERVARGDRAALRSVYDLTSAKLHGICLHLLRDPALAEDVLQEVYLKVWQSAAAFDPERSSPITWLCLIARNRALDWRRAMGRHEEAVRMATQLTEDLQSIPDVHGDAAERDRLVHRCIDDLVEDQRTSIRAAFLDGYTYIELAERTGTPLGTVKSWIRRGLAQIRKCIEDA
ncbi:MAG: sigma-70 family RNA polymerase sigma factor [Pseudomonadota bacterium]